jgi:hypothetical protein
MADNFLETWNEFDFKSISSETPEPKSSARSLPASVSNATTIATEIPHAVSKAAARSSSVPPIQDLYKKELAMKELENLQLRTQVEMYKKAAEAAEQAARSAPSDEVTTRLDRLEKLIKDQTQEKQVLVTATGSSSSSLANVAPPDVGSSSSGSGLRTTLNEKTKQGQADKHKRPRGGRHRVLF